MIQFMFALLLTACNGDNIGLEDYSADDVDELQDDVTSVQDGEAQDGDDDVDVDVDGDGDGYTINDGDCDDTNPDVSPDATETCDDIDNDCDGEIDEELLSVFYVDTDADGYGDPASSSEACTQPKGYVTNNTDCDDNNAQAFEIDECNECGGDNSCLDCAGTPNGSAMSDECGNCDEDPSNDCVQDCAGSWGGDSFLDCSNNCIGGYALEWIDDGYCDDGSVYADFNCEDFECDGSDCFGIGMCADCDDGLLIEMFDSYGDSWNGNDLVVGTESYTVETGSEAMACYTGPMDVVVTCDGGSWQNEVSWTISDPNGTILLNGGAPFEGCLGTCGGNGNGGYPSSDCQGQDYAGYENWIGDGSCDDGIYGIYFDCDDFNCDEGDCECDSGETGSEDCVVVTVDGGSWQTEVSWEITDCDGNTILDGYAPFSGEICDLSDDYEVLLYDSYGDGWNGNIMTIGDEIYTLDEGDFGSFGTCGGDTGSEYCTSIVVNGGSWQTEISWDITDCNGGVILSGGAPFVGESCDLDDGYQVEMYDSYGDGWNGNVMTIGDAVYGQDFTTGEYDSDGTCDDIDSGECSGLIVQLSDSYGDGWNGNYLTIGGETFTIDTGSEESGCYTGPMDVPVTCDGGSWQSEITWSIMDTSGNILLSGGAPYSDCLGSC